MKSSFFTRFVAIILLLFGVGNSALGQSDKSAIYTSNVTLSGGTNGSSCKVIISGTQYDGIKVGTASADGNMTIVVPSGTKYLHLHIAGWNGETPSVSISPASGLSASSISCTSDSGISGTGTSYTLNGTPNSSDYYKVITFQTTLTENTTLSFSVNAKKKRFVIWGVNSETAGSSPTISLNKSSTSIVAGSTETLNATTNPTGAAVTWESDDEDVATVDADGTIHAVSVGTATITAKLTNNPGISATCAVTVTPISRSISMTTTAINLTVGGATQTRTGTLSAGTGSIEYSSDDTDVATVNQTTGEVTPVGVGSCTITASVPATGNYAAASESYTVNVIDPNNMSGTINFNTSGTVKGIIKINSASESGVDNLDNNWSVVTVGTDSYTQAASYSQVGSSSKPATSITFAMALTDDVSFKSISANLVDSQERQEP